MRNKVSLSFLLMKLPLAFVCVVGCATATLVVQVDPSDSSIYKVSKDDASGANANLLGKSPVTVRAGELDDEVLRIEKDGFDAVYMYFPSTKGDGVAKVTLKAAQEEVRRKMLDMESQLESAKKELENARREKASFSEKRHSMSLSMVRAQRFLHQGALVECEAALVPIFSLPQDIIPASAYTLRAKLRVRQNRQAEAKADLEMALKNFSGETEAKSLSQSLR
jgi:hypothetical protein